MPMKKRKNISTKKMERFLNQARELQWAGKHEQAIEVCTQALEVIGKGSSGTAQIQVELLYTRAESNWALIRSPDEVRNDTNLMMQIADDTPNTPKEKKLALKVKALIFKGRIHNAFDNNNDLAREALTDALKIARQSKQKNLEAESLYWFVLVVGFGQETIKFLQRAADIFQSLGDGPRHARALSALARAVLLAGRTEEARQIAKLSLAICEQIGDSYGKSWALSTLSQAQTDQTLQLELMKQAYQAGETAGSIERLHIINNNLT